MRAINHPLPTSCLAASLLALTSGLAFGQANPPATQTSPPPRDQTYQGSEPPSNTNFYGGGGWGGGYHSSTATGDALQGMGAAISAQGQKNLDDSMAARNMEEAYSRALDNRSKRVETYRWREDSAKQRQQQQMAEHRAEMEPWLEKKRLKALTPQQYDQTTGAVSWPMLCKDPKYKDYREKLDALLVKRATYGGLSMDEYMEVEKLIKDFRMAITADSKKYNYPSPPVDQALRFLLSLNRELNEQFG